MSVPVGYRTGQLRGPNSTLTGLRNPRGYCPNHSTGVKLADDFDVTPLQYVDGPEGPRPLVPTSTMAA